MRRTMVLGSLAVLVSLAGGCGPVSRPVAFSSPGVISPPERGKPIHVVVVDERDGDAESWFGVIHGGDLVADLVLQEGGSLAERIRRDLVASLRTAGYRADDTDSTTAPSGATLQVRVIQFAIKAKAPAFKKTAWLVSSAFVVRCARDAGEALWWDLVYTRREEATSLVWSRKEEDAIIERLYRSAIAELITGFTDAVAP